MLDFTLEVGALSEQITVTAQVPLVEQEPRRQRRDHDDRRAKSTRCRFFGRNTFYTAIATPNVVQTGDPLVRPLSGPERLVAPVDGWRPRRGNAYLLEGVSITDFSNRAAWVPSAESLADMRVQVKTYDAEMGRAAGGAFNVTAKSGSNAIHGSALFLNKPGWGMGNLFFAKRAGMPIPPQYYYNWAGSVGGPIARDKTFFWFSTDDYVQQSTRNIVAAVSDRARARGRLLADVQCVRSTGRDLRSADDADGQRAGDSRSVPGNRIPADRHQPDRAELSGRDSGAGNGSGLPNVIHPQRRPAEPGDAQDSTTGGLTG